MPSKVRKESFCTSRSFMFSVNKIFQFFLFKLKHNLVSCDALKSEMGQDIC